MLQLAGKAIRLITTGSSYVKFSTILGVLKTEGYFIKGLHTTKFWTILGVVLTEITVPIAKILSGKNARAWVSMDFT